MGSYDHYSIFSFSYLFHGTTFIRSKKIISFFASNPPIIDKCSAKIIWLAKYLLSPGGVVEWFKALVLKTSVSARVPWVRIPPPPFKQSSLIVSDMFRECQNF